MKILFIAPLPPPVTGHSLAAKVLLEHLALEHDVRVVDLSVDSSHDGAFSWRRVFQVAKVLRATWRQRTDVDTVYLTISESLLGNVKDVLIYAICMHKLDAFHIHLHGGSIGAELFDRRRWLRAVNGWFLRRLAGVIVTGPSHAPIFSGLLAPERIHAVANFAEDYLFLPPAAIEEKFSATSPLRVLYLSGMTQLKGYQDLLEAYLQLDAAARQRIHVDFAGRFDSAEEKQAFLARIAGVPGVYYHGVADADAKRRLFGQAHLFCLPSGYREGQPIAILEAYASGCVVLSTLQGGIGDVFADGVNGFAIAKSPAAIAGALRAAAGQAGSLLQIAMTNRTLAGSNYTVARHRAALANIIVSPRSL